MSYKKRIYAAVLIICLAAGVFAVGKSGMQMKSEQEREQQESFLNRRKDTLRLWYMDESLTDYLNAAAVAYSEQSDVRVETVLIEDSEYIEAINDASLGRSDRPGPDLYLITNDCLEKAYLAGLAAEITEQNMFRNIDYESQGAEAAVTYDGKVVAYPFYYEACALLYNKTYLEDHYQEKITLEHLSDQFFINKFYLTRIFKEEFGISINSYLTQIRITHAKQQLRFTNKTIEQIGFSCGIEDANYFSRIFKKIEGTSPGEYRKRW